MARMRQKRPIRGGENGQPAGAGSGANIRQHPDLVSAKQLRELVKAAGRVADAEDAHKSKDEVFPLSPTLPREVGRENGTLFHKG